MDELAGDEATHRDAFAQALKAISEPSSGAKVPRGPSVDPFPIAAGEPHSTGVTLDNLFATLRGESFANAEYMAYGLRARQQASHAWPACGGAPATWICSSTSRRPRRSLGSCEPRPRTCATRSRGRSTRRPTSTSAAPAKHGPMATTRRRGCALELAGDEAGHALRFIHALQQLELPG